MASFMLGLDGYDTSDDDGDASNKGVEFQSNTSSDEELEPSQTKESHSSAEARTKRKIPASLLPSAAELFSAVSAPTFLGKTDPSNDICQVKRKKEETQSLPIKTPASTVSQPKLASLAVSTETALPLSESLQKKKETTRQKNNRKERLGQAKFTIKSERECPDIWRG